jgi:hypothetical protein
MAFLECGRKPVIEAQIISGSERPATNILRGGPAACRNSVVAAALSGLPGKNGNFALPGLPSMLQFADPKNRYGQSVAQMRRRTIILSSYRWRGGQKLTAK